MPYITSKNWTLVDGAGGILIPSPRTGHTTVYYNGFMIMFGGFYEDMYMVFIIFN